MWTVERPEEIPENTMLVGIDIYNKLLLNKKSCIGFTATTNKEMNQFYNRVLIESPGNNIK